jgi:NAD(P)-dependent dehydrogenase (short-subunit alcohol dehydrogenase family)
MAKEPRSLHGQVAAITGAARGIGRATAAALAREGAKVSIGDLDAELAERAARELGSGAVGFALDVTDRSSFERFLDETEKALGPLDVLVNNAGIMPLSRFVEEDDATAIRQIDINLHGVIYGTKSALRRMEPRGRGHIVNIASSAGKSGLPGAATYSATKHAVVGLSESVRGELQVAGSAIEVSCVMPVLVNTELSSGLGKTRGLKTQQPEDVADAIVEALKFPAFDVFVPKSVGTILKVSTVLPRAGREAISRALKADRVLLEIDAARRQGYELRAARSEPALEGGKEAIQLPSGGPDGGEGS